ncbi:MAG: PadR family transcriptional regulator [Firmicutes bacterium]|nr:PadR family transcriptional regulator [Bacillota bacterium]
MEYVILGLLMLRPNTLYGIRKAFEQGISMFYSSSLGSLQTAIKKLSAKGYITSDEGVENGRAKKTLEVTEMGREAFFKWMLAPLDSNNLEVSFLSRLYFMGLLPSKAQQLEQLKRMKIEIEQEKSNLVEVDQQLSGLKLPLEYQPVFFYQRKVLHYGIDTHEYGLKWLQTLIDEIESN